jgi:hypothetical protein
MAKASQQASQNSPFYVSKIDEHNCSFLLHRETTRGVFAPANGRYLREADGLIEV